MNNATRIYTEEEAMAIVVRIAESNTKAVSKDIDACLEDGEVLVETVLQGYLWDCIVAEIGRMDDEVEELLSIAIVDYYCDQMEDLYSLEYEEV